MEKQFAAETRSISKEWKNSKQWKGYLCPSYYNYDLRMFLLFKDIRFDLNGDGSINAFVEAGDINLNGVGSYRSTGSLCIAFKGASGILVDSAAVKARVVFLGDETHPKVDVHILSISFGAIHINGNVPEWINTWLSKSLNWTMQKLWGSKLGEWLDGYITKQINENFPKPID